MKLCEFCGEYFHRAYFRFCYHCAAKVLEDEVKDWDEVTDEVLQSVMELSD